MARKKKNPSDINYYNEETEKAFIAYMEPLNEEEALKIASYKPDGKHEMGKFKLSDIEREKLYVKYLQKPMDKLAELVMKSYGYHQRKDIDFKDLHADAMSYLALIFSKFRVAEGKKSYSYFGTCVKHYAMNQKRFADKKVLRDLDIDDYYHDVMQRSDQIYEIDSVHFDPTKFIEEFIAEMKVEIYREGISDSEFKVGIALISIFEDRENIFDFAGENKNSNNFNKNNILKMLRDLTLLETKVIRKAMKRFKSTYIKFKVFHLEMDNEEFITKKDNSYEEVEDENPFIDSDYL
jgi:hypothetical protein